MVRTSLRRILGRYLGVTPRDLHFVYNKCGKPSLRDWPHLRFNVSHSGGRALIAAATYRDVGVDIEAIRPLPDCLSLAQRFFASQEYLDLISLNPVDQQVAFYRCWTRKEALLKCVGDGLSLPLDTFRVTASPEQPARIVGAPDCVHPELMWALRDLPVGDGYAAAFACVGIDPNIVFFSIEDLDHFD